MEFVFGLLLTIGIPLIFLYAIRQLDFYQTGQFKTIALGLVLGGIAYTPAAIINGSIAHLTAINIESIERFIAPVNEEIIKALFLFYLLKRSQFTYSVDGLLYGLTVGIGFAVLENIFYVTNISNAANIALQRIFTTSLVHAFSSAVTGITLVTFRSGTRFLKWLVPLIGLLLAIAQHMFYNNIIHTNVLVNNEMHPTLTYIPGILGVFFMYGVIRHGKNQAREWINEKLGLVDRITRNEIAAVDRFATTDDILFPIVERFGPDKASLVEKLLFHQARMGIKRNSLDSIRDNPNIHAALEAEIREMHDEMEKLRRKIGAYVMLFVRGLFTEEMVSVWGQMQAKIQARSAATGGQKGGGLWTSLDNRLNPSPEDEGSD